MKFFKLMNTFSKDEDGAVTVDWVVLTAALVGIALALVGTVKGGLDTASGDIADAITGAIDEGTST